MAQQLALSVELRDDARFANFFPGDNAEIVHCLQQQWTTQGEPFIYLWGSTGSGLSHLLQASCHYAEGIGHHSVYLPLEELAHYGPSVLEGMEQLPLVALDHLQTVVGLPEWEEALFHLFNRIRERQSHLIVAANAIPNQLNIKLADLKSRLNSGICLPVRPLNDEDKISALMLRARKRGLNLSDEVARFILNRRPRDMQGLFTLLDELDQASLIERRKLTIPFVKAHLGHQ